MRYVGPKAQASLPILSADMGRNLPAQPRWVRAGASLTTLGSSGLTSCSLLPSNLSAAITETFLSSFPALRLASPLIPAECVECWTTELSSQAARGNRRGNEEQQSTRAPECPQQGPSHVDEHKPTRAHLQKRCPRAARSGIKRAACGNWSNLCTSDRNRSTTDLRERQRERKTTPCENELESSVGSRASRRCFSHIAQAQVCSGTTTVKLLRRKTKGTERQVKYHDSVRLY